MAAQRTSSHPSGEPPDGPPPQRRPRRAAAAPSASILSILDSGWVRSLLNKAPLGFLTYTSVVATYRARSDPWTAAFVVSAYVLLMLFFWCVGSYEVAPPEKKGRLKIIIWVLSTILVILFPFKLSSTMSFAFNAVIWSLGGITIAIISYLFFIDGKER